MQKIQFSKKIITILIIAFFCLSATLTTLICLIKPNTNSYTTSTLTTSNAVFVDEIWDSTNKKFSKDNAVALLETISSDGSGDIDTIESDLGSDGVKTASEIFTQKSSKSIVVTLGGIKWIVTYLSKDKSGNVIATLYQADSSTTKSTIGNSSYYGKNAPTSGVPTNMYGTSYIRAVTLNNGGCYINITGNVSNPSSVGLKATQSSSHEYALFTVPALGLTQHLVQPLNVSWQESGQSNVDLFGLNGNCSNENWSDSVADTEFYDSSYNYAGYYYSNVDGGQSGNGDWKYDYLWLPSLSETGYSGANGIWQINEKERSSSNDSVWLRSAAYNYSYRAYGLDSSGNGYSNTFINSSRAVRPSLHLNLKSIHNELIDLWDSTNKTLIKDNTKSVLQDLSSDGSGDLDQIITDITNSGGSITASELYTRNNSNSTYIVLGGITWLVTYLSIDSNGNPYATLYQADTNLTSWFAGNTSAGGYDGGSNTSTPSNLYSRSYIRVVTLNAGGTYYNYGGASTNIDSSSVITTSQSESNPYALFTMSTYGLTQHLIQPKNIPYQVNSQGTSYTGLSYALNNESLSTGGSYSGMNYSTNSATSSVYSEWGNDYVWLPSLSETGYNDSYKGIWQLSITERSNSTNNVAWVRSTRDNASEGVCSLSSGGYGYSYYNVSNLQAVRPAIHLNLASLASIFTTPVTLDQQSGTGGTTKVEASGNMPMPLITPPTRANYVFGGYFTSTNGTGTKYYNADGTSAINYPASGGATTLYAYWIPLYTITTTSQNSDLGTTFGSGTYQQGTSITIFAVPKSGYAFLYWLVSINGGTATQNPANPLNTTATANTTYTAVFGKGIEGIQVAATYGGMAAVIGDNYESLESTDTITLVATVCVTGYQFKHWQNQDGTILASGEENKTFLIPKSQAMDSIITAVFEPIT